MYTLVDLRGFVMRSYFSGKDPDGVVDPETGKLINTAQYGFEVFIERYLTKWLEQAQPEKVLFALEGGSEFRLGFYPDYKKGRNASQSELQKEQLIELSKKVEDCLLKMGLTMCRQNGAEADDLIAYLCKELDGRKLVHTVDKDLAVLCSLDPVTVCYHSVKNGEQFYSTEVDGLPAKYVTLNKSLVGDPSDNYKGVKGFGEKAWDELVAAYGIEGLRELNKYIVKRDFDGLKQDAEELDDKRLMLIYNNKEDWILSYNLARLYPSLCNTVNGRKKNSVEWMKRVPSKDYYQDLIELFTGNPDCVKTLKDLTPEFTLVTQDNLLKEEHRFADLLKNSKLIAWDFETHDFTKNESYKKAAKSDDFVSVLDQEITGCSFALGKCGHKVFYLSCNHLDTNNVGKGTVLEWILKCESSGLDMVAQNSQFEASVARQDLKHSVKDMTDTAMFAKNLFEEDPAGLKGLSKKFLDYTQTSYQEVVGDKSGMAELTGEEVLSYGCDDSLVTYSLLHLFWVMSELEGTKDFIMNYDCPSMHLLVDSFVKGCPIDLDRLEELAKQDSETDVRLMEKVRNSLQEHCSTVDQESYETLVTELCGFKRKDMRLKGKPKEEIAEKIEEMEEEILKNCSYTPLTEYKKKIEFKPTSAQINKVLGILGSDLLVDGMSAKALTEVLIQAEQSKCCPKFWNLLGKCIGPNLKKRQGPDYEVFAEYCASVLEQEAPTIKAGTELNFDSPKQMIYLFYGMLGLPIRMRTPVKQGSVRDQLGMEGGPSTNEKALQIAGAEDCQGENAWKLDIILDVIEITKCRTRAKLYWTPYPLWADNENRTIHPQIKQSATVTNRPTGASPNLLQVSKKDGGHVRSIFVPYEDEVYVSIDFAGQELRIAASLSEDPIMLDAYLGETPKDLHSVTACAIAKPLLSRMHKHINLADIEWEGGVVKYDFLRHVLDTYDKKHPLYVALNKVRAASKTLNFGVIYGASASGIAMQLMIPKQVAEELVDALFSRYKRLPIWKEEVCEFGRNHGYVETAYGNKRHCWPNIVSKDSMLKSRMERQVCNFVVQGTASDILKIVMTEAYKQNVFSDTGATLLAPVYDEVASRVPKNKVVEYVNRMSSIMHIKTPGLAVPQIPEVSIGETWGYQKELGAFPKEEDILKCLEEIA